MDSLGINFMTVIHSVYLRLQKLVAIVEAESHDEPSDSFIREMAGIERELSGLIASTRDARPRLPAEATEQDGRDVGDKVSSLPLHIVGGRAYEGTPYMDGTVRRVPIYYVEFGQYQWKWRIIVKRRDWAPEIAAERQRDKEAHADHDDWRLTVETESEPVWLDKGVKPLVECTRAMRLGAGEYLRDFHEYIIKENRRTPKEIEAGENGAIAEEIDEALALCEWLQQKPMAATIRTDIMH